MPGEIVPFGKYKGQPAEILAADRDYCEWLLAQPWFASRYGNVYNIVVSYGGEPQDSPEHNEMQARFLEDDWCLQLAAVLVPSLAHSYGEDGALSALFASPLVREFAKCCIKETEPAAVTARGFEVSGWDVMFKAKPVKITARTVIRIPPLPPCTCECDHSGCSKEGTCQGGEDDWYCKHRKCTAERGTIRSDHCTMGCPWGDKGAMQQSVEDQPGAYHWRRHDRHYGYGDATKADWLHYGMQEGHAFSADRPPQFLVELKPDLGDDYPAVLRQVTGYKDLGGEALRCVVARRHAFEKVTWEQVKKIFAASSITLVAESEIEAAADPEKRVLAFLERELGAEVIAE